MDYGDPEISDSSDLRGEAAQRPYDVVAGDIPSQPWSPATVRRQIYVYIGVERVLCMDLDDGLMVSGLALSLKYGTVRERTCGVCLHRS